VSTAVDAPLRLSSLQPALHFGVGVRSSTRMTFIRLFWWAQLLMVVANLGRIPVLSTDERDFPLAFNELCLGAMLIGACLTVRSWKSVFVDRVALTALVFAAIGGASAVWSVSRFGMSALELFVSLAFLARWLMYFLLYVALINVVREANVESVWDAVETMLVILALFGIVQSAFLPNFTQMVYSDNRSFNWDEQGHRLVSTVLEPNIAGTMLMIGVVVQAARLSAGARVSGMRMLIVFTGLTLTISRSAAVGLFFGMLVILAARGLSRRLVKVMVAAGSLVVLASPFLIQYLMAYNKFSIGEGSSAAVRLTVWLQAIRLVLDYPVFGIGFNAYRYAIEYYGADIIGASSYGAEGGLLFITTMTGFVGLAVYCGMIGLVIMRCRAIWRDETVSPGGRGLAIGAAAATVGVVFASTFVNALLTTFVMEILWVLWALTFVIARSQRARQVVPRASSSTQLVALAA
jgi:hypothetical protein